MKKRLALILLIGLLSLPIGAANPRPVVADISGTWVFLHYLNKGVKPVSYVLKQQGEKVTGVCCTPEEMMTGAVRGNEVTFEKEKSTESKNEKITYRGALETPTKMSGTRTIIRDTEQVQQKWTATKQDR
jgi:hypothetical protein